MLCKMWEKRYWHWGTEPPGTWPEKAAAGTEVFVVIWRAQSDVPKMVSGLGFCGNQASALKASALGCGTVAVIVPRQ